MKLRDYKNIRVLVTGGGGFLGANLVRELISQKAQVNLFLKTSTKPWRLKEVLNQVKIYPVNLDRKKEISQAVGKIKPEVIFHLAVHGAYPTQTDLNQMINTNIQGTINLLDAVNQYPYRSLVNTGTSSEYGYKEKPMKETDLLEPTFFYAATKAAATLLCQVYAKNQHKPIVTLRPFSIYGEWEEPSRFIPTIIYNCLKNKPVKLVGGKQARDFLYVKDLVRAYLMAGQRSDLSGEIINLGSGKQSLVSQTAKIIIQLIGNPVKVQMGKYKPRVWDTTNWLADINKADKLLNWRPEYNLETGLRQTIDWYKINLKYYENN